MGGVADFVGDAVSGAADVVGDVGGGIVDGVGEVASGIGDVGEFAAPIALPALGSATGFALGGPVGAGVLGGALGGAAGGATSGLAFGGDVGTQAALGGLGGGLTAGLGGFGNAAGNAGFLPSTSGGASQVAFNTPGGAASGFGSAFPAALGGATSSLGSSLVSGGGGFGNLATSALGGALQTQQLGRIADAQRAANRQAQQTLSPFVGAGASAQNRLGQLLGLSGEDSDEVLEQLRSSPGFQFRLDQGQEALDRSLAAKGGLLSGRAVEETQRLGQGLADQTFTDFTNTLQKQARQGLGAARSQAGLQGAVGDIRANRIGAQGDVLNRTLADILAPRV